MFERARVKRQLSRCGPVKTTFYTLPRIEHPKVYVPRRQAYNAASKLRLWYLQALLGPALAHPLHWYQMSLLQKSRQ